MRKINNLDSKWKGSGTSLSLSASYSSPLNIPPIKLSLQHRSRFLRRVEITLHPVNGQLCPLFSFKPSPAITPNLSWEGNHSKSLATTIHYTLPILNWNTTSRNSRTISIFFFVSVSSLLRPLSRCSYCLRLVSTRPGRWYDVGCPLLKARCCSVRGLEFLVFLPLEIFLCASKPSTSLPASTLWFVVQGFADTGSVLRR